MLNREAKEPIGGFRLQKLRAVEHILDHLESYPNEDIAVAIEILEDVYILKNNRESFEQNKNYDPDSKFSLNSEEVLNSLCSFIDIWIDNQLSNAISFCFLSTNSIAKEKTTKRITKLNITLPKTKIIEELASHDNNRIKKVSSITKKILIDYYQEKYSKNPNTVDTIETLKNLSEKSWIGFLNQIAWKFEHQSLEETETLINDKIRHCRYYSQYDNKGQEDIIKSSLVDLVEQKTLKKHNIFRLVQNADVELKFTNAIYQKASLISDDVHILWESMESPTDFRKLQDKILSVCPTFSQKRLKHLERKAAMAKVAENNLKNSSQYLALKYRVYAYCEEKLENTVSDKSENIYTEKEIDQIINEINSGCISEFEDLKKQYDYGIERNSVVLELFIEFIDSCYLAFD